MANVHMAALLLRPARLFATLYSFPWYRDMLCDAVEITRWAGRDVLELGSAAGHLSRALAEAGAHVLAVDQSHAMVQASMSQGSGIRRLRANALALPLPDNAFDATFAASLLNVVQQPAALLKEMLRVTRPGGRLVVLFPAEGFSTEQALAWSNTQGLRGIERVAYLTWHRLARKLAVTDVQRTLSALGLRTVEMQCYLGGMVVAFRADLAP